MLVEEIEALNEEIESIENTLFENNAIHVSKEASLNQQEIDIQEFLRKEMQVRLRSSNQ